MEATTEDAPASDEKVKAIVQAVATRIASGESHDAIAADLVEAGLEDVQARRLIADIEDRMYAGQPAPTSDSGVPGWLIWIGGLVTINVLSAIFDWPFWVY